MSKTLIISLIGIFFLGFSPAFAADNFAAIAFSQTTGAHGYAYDYSSRGEAERRALNGCAKHGSGCKVPIWVRNGCAALAVGTGNGYGTGWAANSNAAQRAALNSCARASRNCAVRRWVCTTR